MHQDLNVELGLAIDMHPENVEKANEMEHNHPELVAELPNAVLPESPPAGGESRNPPIAVMVEEAFDRLKKLNGIFLEEICTYLQENCIVSNVNKTRPFIRRYLAKKVSQREVMEVGIGSEIKYKRVPTGKKNKF